MSSSLVFRIAKDQNQTYKYDPAINRWRRGSDVSFNSVSRFGDLYSFPSPGHSNSIHHPHSRLGDKPRGSS